MNVHDQHPDSPYRRTLKRWVVGLTLVGLTVTSICLILLYLHYS